MNKILFLFGIFLGVFFSFSIVSAISPSDFDLKEGDLISAIFSDDPDVYIINEHGYKRLFLNPEIFKFYSHLGGFANIKLVTPEVRDGFPTVGLFRNCEKNDLKVYGFGNQISWRNIKCWVIHFYSFWGHACPHNSTHLIRIPLLYYYIFA